MNAINLEAQLAGFAEHCRLLLIAPAGTPNTGDAATAVVLHLVYGRGT